MIQDYTDTAAQLEPHFGYADRILPCKSDSGSCAYLDVIYGSHDRGIFYTGILWGTIVGILAAWGLGRRIVSFRRRTRPGADGGRNNDGPDPEQQQQRQRRGAGQGERMRRAIAATSRRYLLPNTPLRAVFGHTTRLQVIMLGVLAGYLAVWSFAGMVAFGTWRTPVKGQQQAGGDGVIITNTRTSLGPWANRVGVLAYSLTPLSVLLASRESALSLATGLPYTSFVFLHRWVGHIVLLQSVLHTAGWIIVEARLYRPQPTVWQAFVAHGYVAWGFAALALLVLLWALALGWTVRRVTGYEVFRKAHYVLAMLYIGALVPHWVKLKCFLVPAMALWAADRLVRLVRTAALHCGWPEFAKGSGPKWLNFEPATALAGIWRDDQHGDIVRLKFHLPQSHAARGRWRVGQHFFLCFAEGRIWQSHPFTPLSLPMLEESGLCHEYVFRAKKGETGRIARLVAAQGSSGPGPVTMPVIVQGPYGIGIADGLRSQLHVNVLCIAGGTGIAYVLPVLLDLVRDEGPGLAESHRHISLIWAIKRARDVEWVPSQLQQLHARGVNIRLFVTDDDEPSVPRPALLDEKGAEVMSTQGHKAPPVASGPGIVQRPDLESEVDQFVSGTEFGPTKVFGSGPPGMISDLRAAVAKANSGPKVWKGEDRFDIKLTCDDRLE
ncbi:ferric reductase like transmembrane component-domain-containing protein [Lasiosphaeria miniovina]|uniref:Ferric reductase like transmembrane component-domain-containing protein n=1 Tax=Lasiosphaeria miniovina TaxID=1954250 RepID=A0AA39ZT36_9PEZI|nr:ferric reductase like transmembrane component-domain-containing protein [Lasiosphaeria miniovina]KAK0703080.1 ferric reductase like transmembrane component-domain-containing protein [Lasiosphaeria miniovina]